MTSILTHEEKELVASFIKYGHDGNEVYHDSLNVDRLLKNWHQGKQNLFKKFGNKLIIEIPTKAIHYNPKNVAKALEVFIAASDLPVNLVVFLEQLHISEIVHNKLIKAITIDGCTIGKENMRVTKSVRYFFKNQKRYDEFLVNYSKLLQECRISGVLCISIHPLDYLTMSHNKANWSNCHGLGGPRQGGILSYMYDPTTVVAYLRSNTLKCLEAGVWNSKKWRTLVHIHQEDAAAFFSKHYPFRSETLEEAVREKIIQICDIQNPTVYTYRTEPFINAINYEDDRERLHYSDLLSDSAKAILIKEKNEYISTFEIGAVVHCLGCDSHVVTDAGLMYCEYCCRKITRCIFCGVAVEDGYDGIEVCADCRKMRGD